MYMLLKCLYHGVYFVVYLRASVIMSYEGWKDEECGVCSNCNETMGCESD